MSLLQEYGASLKYHDTTKAYAPLGTLVQEKDHLYRYVKATAAIAAGENVIGKSAYHTITNITGFKNTADETTSRGANYIEDTAETMTPGLYVGGFLHLGTGTGVGQTKRITENSATRIYYEAMHRGMGESNAFGTDPDTTTDIVVIAPWHVLKCAASDKIQTVMGCAPIAFTSGRYGWIVVSGLVSMKCGGTGVLDTVIVPGDDTAGQATIAGTGDDVGDCTPVGVAMFAGADDTSWPVLLRGTAL